MKAILAAALAAVALGSAQAVTWNWTHDPTSNYGTVTESDGLQPVTAWNGSTGGSMTYAAKMTIGGTVTEPTVILKLSNSEAGGNTDHVNNNGVSVSIDSDGHLTLTVSNTNNEGWGSAPSSGQHFQPWTYTEANLLDGQAHAIGIAIDNQSGTVAFYVDGQEMKTFGGGDYAIHFYKTELDTLQFGAEGGLTSDIELAVANGILNASDVTIHTIPEPTALALLALGAAGLALRRRAV